MSGSLGSSSTSPLPTTTTSGAVVGAQSAAKSTLLAFLRRPSRFLVVAANEALPTCASCALWLPKLQWWEQSVVAASQLALVPTRFLLVVVVASAAAFFAAFAATAADPLARSRANGRYSRSRSNCCCLAGARLRFACTCALSRSLAQVCATSASFHKCFAELPRLLLMNCFFDCYSRQLESLSLLLSFERLVLAQAQASVRLSV